MKRVGVLILVLVTIATSSCRPGYPRAYEDFINLPYSERPAALSKYPPEEQVDRYVWAMVARHPPQIELADVVAQNGAEVLPIVLRRIEEEESDPARVFLLHVILRMQQMGKADVAGDAEKMAVLGAAVSSMHDPDWKPQAVAILKQLQREQA